MTQGAGRTTGKLKVRHLAVELPVAVAGRFGAGRAADLLDLLDRRLRRRLGFGLLVGLGGGFLVFGHAPHDAAGHLDSPPPEAMFSRMNYMKTALLLAALTGFFLVVGYLLGGQTGLVIALVVALGMNLFAYWNSDSMVLR